MPVIYSKKTGGMLYPLQNPATRLAVHFATEKNQNEGG